MHSWIRRCLLFLPIALGCVGCFVSTLPDPGPADPAANPHVGLAAEASASPSSEGRPVSVSGVIATRDSAQNAPGSRPVLARDSETTPVTIASARRFDREGPGSVPAAPAPLGGADVARTPHGAEIVGSPFPVDVGEGDSSAGDQDAKYAGLNPLDVQVAMTRRPISTSATEKNPTADRGAYKELTGQRDGESGPSFPAPKMDSSTEYRQKAPIWLLKNYRDPDPRCCPKRRWNPASLKRP